MTDRNPSTTGNDDATWREIKGFPTDLAGLKREWLEMKEQIQDLGRRVEMLEYRLDYPEGNP